MKIIYSNSTCIIKNRMYRYTTFSNSCCNLYCETSLNCYCILLYYYITILLYTAY